MSGSLDGLVFPVRRCLLGLIAASLVLPLKRLDRRPFDFARPFFQDYELEEYLKLVSD